MAPVVHKTRPTSIVESHFPREYYSISHALLLIASKLLSIVAQTAEFTPSRHSCTSHTCMMRAETSLA
ncbi:hypothetical protein HZ326_3601 [Fusarium oxysporum f. sp. albedinis]|nr:hypothetical protein HZ326_3601 [Fusarium oxysporum f. sp. albedinis]